jgi:hypothetical protein
MSLKTMNQKDIGFWTVIEVISAKRNENREIERTVKVQCKCGYTKVSLLNNTGKSKQCSACATLEIRNRISEEDRILRDRLQGVYQGIKSRCEKPNRKDYKDYGARGIKVEESFNSFSKFFDWMISEGYTYDCNLQVDRKDNDGNYSINNCRLVSKADNNRNQSRNVMTWDIVNDIRYGKYVGVSSKQVALEVGCSERTINSVKTFKTWNI